MLPSLNGIGLPEHVEAAGSRLRHEPVWIQRRRVEVPNADIRILHLVWFMCTVTQEPLRHRDLVGIVVPQLLLHGVLVYSVDSSTMFGCPQNPPWWLLGSACS